MGCGKERGNGDESETYIGGSKVAHMVWTARRVRSGTEEPEVLLSTGRDQAANGNGRAKGAATMP